MMIMNKGGVIMIIIKIIVMLCVCDIPAGCAHVGIRHILLSAAVQMSPLSNLGPLAPMCLVHC